MVLGRGGEQMKVVIDGDPKEIAALVLALQEQQLPKIAEDVLENIADGLSRAASSVHIPE